MYKINGEGINNPSALLVLSSHYDHSGGHDLYTVDDGEKKQATPCLNAQ